jgi:hypothetical protein
MPSSRVFSFTRPAGKPQSSVVAYRIINIRVTIGYRQSVVQKRTPDVRFTPESHRQRLPAQSANRRRLSMARGATVFGAVSSLCEGPFSLRSRGRDNPPPASTSFPSSSCSTRQRHLDAAFREFGALVGGQMFVLHDKPQVIDL